MFKELSSVCWRGYVAEWEIEDNRLYLINIKLPSFPERKETYIIKNTLQL